MGLGQSRPKGVSPEAVPETGVSGLSVSEATSLTGVMGV
jgi:hypothetical protein